MEWSPWIGVIAMHTVQLTGRQLGGNEDDEGHWKRWVKLDITVTHHRVNDVMTGKFGHNGKKTLFLNFYYFCL